MGENVKAFAFRDIPTSYSSSEMKARVLKELHGTPKHGGDMG